MALSCSPEALASPQLFGGHVISLEANLVENYNATAYGLLYYGHPTVTVKNLDFCNVTVTYTHPGQNDTIHVETWLPIDNYNGRLQSVGGGGWIAGRYSPSYTAMTGAVGEGYATSTTDAGLSMRDDLGPDNWALASEGNPNLYLLNNFGSVSLQDQAIIAKGLVASFYGQGPEYSYWSGCSQGGRQGMMLAQRYPDAYDGIHACAPALFWNQLLASAFWPQMLMMDMDYYPYPCELKAITTAAVNACDGLDGIVDGIIADDTACAFDPLSLVGESFACSDTGKNMTISQNAATLAKAAWAGPETKGGKFMWYGPNIGSQLTGSTTALTNDIGTAMTSCSSDGKCTGVPVGLGEVWIKYFLEADSEWSYENMTRDDFEHYFHASIQRYDSIIGTNDPDLTAFYKKGGKILGYHGMSDQIIPVKSTEHYYDMVEKVIPGADHFYRMFEVPGLLHCSGGSGGQPSNTFDALRAWVENGTVPEKLPHSYKDDNGEEKNRLLCPYPKMAKIKQDGRSANGTLQSDDFVCV
ncbi:Tannase/feruloyl esterase [Ilyonectria robusta]|uniref:Tannase/feruloyl esterase n=1 Tax=Ilyonectria robusta TaxID=1079257 RepID=UPI001E8DA6A7|nr:Tannase/feruloyl esterase [Ilyonectria robusta]KAH8664775.1 Tannase/feruloyl esterase [Ilyonectria robusta]